MTGIKKGYQLQITSWENDGDYYNTVSLEGLTKEEVEYYIVLLYAIRSTGMENVYCGWDDDRPDTDTDQLIYDFIMEHYKDKPLPESVSEMVENKNFDERDLIGYSEDYYYRVWESYKVFYFPEDVNEVTDNFSVINKDEFYKKYDARQKMKKFDIIPVLESTGGVKWIPEDLEEFFKNHKEFGYLYGYKDYDTRKTVYTNGGDFEEFDFEDDVPMSFNQTFVKNSEGYFIKDKINSLDEEITKLVITNIDDESKEFLTNYMKGKK